MGESFEGLLGGTRVFAWECEFWLEAAQDLVGHSETHAGFEVQAPMEKRIDQRTFFRRKVYGSQGRLSRTG